MNVGNMREKGDIVAIVSPWIEEMVVHANYVKAYVSTVEKKDILKLIVHKLLAHESANYVMKDKE